MNIKKIAQIIKNGGIVIMPTDTVYGIVGDALNENVIKKIYQVKKRDYAKPLIILVNSLEMLKECTSKINKLEEQILTKYWPGELTIIFEKSKLISDLLTAKTSHIAIRYPNDKNLIAVMQIIKRPLIATSANISNEETITNIADLNTTLINEVDLVINNGVIKSKSSTIIKVTNNKLKILREGDLALKIKKEFSNYISKN